VAVPKKKRSKKYYYTKLQVQSLKLKSANILTTKVPYSQVGIKLTVIPQLKTELVTIPFVI
jgi:hypothetical protein